MTKQELFEYSIYKLADLFLSKNPSVDRNFFYFGNNNFSKLKIIKLHFFLCASNVVLFDKFTDFHAMPYGHVEGSLLRLINSDRLLRFHISDHSIALKTNYDAEQLEDSFQLDSDSEAIDIAINNLNDYSPSIINYSASQLVSLSHTWFSWKATYSQARESGIFSKKISKDILKNESKNFMLFRD